MGARTSKHRRQSSVGMVTVHVTPMAEPECDRLGKDAVRIRVTRGGKEIWAPDAPLCLSPLYEADSPEGRSEAADSAIDFFEHALSAEIERNPRDSAKIEIGTVVSGTLRLPDLVSAFLGELERIDPHAAGEMAREYRGVLQTQDWQSEDAGFLMDALFEALDERAPEGMYFGAHVGDGADFGWWPLED